MRRLACSAMLVASFCFPVRAAAPPPVFITAVLPTARVMGHAHLTYLMMDIYDATLFAPGGIWHSGAPAALSLTYLRHLSGARIADRSVDEIRNQGFGDTLKLAAWHAQMTTIFPDVEDGTTLTALLDAKGQTLFFRDGTEIGSIRDPDFGRWFFDIWLGDKTSQPKLRDQLLNQSE